MLLIFIFSLAGGGVERVHPVLLTIGLRRAEKG